MWGWCINTDKKNSIQFRQIDALALSTDVIECIFVELRMKTSNIIVGCVYRPPSSNLKTFNAELSNILSGLDRSNDVYILGDYNILSGLDRRNDVYILGDYNILSGLDRSNDVYILGDYNILSGLDRSNDVYILEDYNILSGLDISNDVYILGDYNILSGLDRSYDVYILRDYNIDLLRHKSHNNTSNFINLMLTSYIPLINKPTRVTETIATIIDNIFTNSNNWSNISRGILPTDVSDHFSIFCIVPGQMAETRANGSFHKRLVNDRILKSKLKTTRYKNLLEVNRGNLRKVWDTLNSVIHRKKRTLRCSTFKHNDSEIDNDKTISQLFNKFFLNAPKDLYMSLPPQTEDPTSNISPNSNSLYLTPANADEVLRILLHMKNSSAGHDDFDAKSVKFVAVERLEPLIHICNLSLSRGEFPDDMKIARVVPIHKKGSRDQFSNYNFNFTHFL